jgi:hypothetical protein
MPTYFIDFQGCYDEDGLIIKELCIMDANELFKPLHEVYKPTIKWNLLPEVTKTTNKYLTQFHHKLTWGEGTMYFCPHCILQKLNLNNLPNTTFYVLDTINGSKIKVLQRHFPSFRFVNYGKTIGQLIQTPPNICCSWKEHGEHCAYKQCLAMAIDYLKCY